MEIINLFHFFVFLLTRIFIELLILVQILIVRCDVTKSYFIFVLQVHLLKELEIFVLGQGSMLRELFPADVSDLVKQVMGVGASWQILNKWVQGSISFFTC